MPRKLFSSSSWSFIIIDSEDLQCGDVLFLKNRKKSRLISHAAMALSNKEIFHCSPSLVTARAQLLDDFFADYEQKLSWEKALYYVDSRSR